MLVVGVVGTYPNKLAGNIIVINMARATGRLCTGGEAVAHNCHLINNKPPSLWRGAAWGRRLEWHNHPGPCLVSVQFLRTVK